MNYCAILASGSGTRMGNTTLPKQFLMVDDKPLIFYTLDTLLSIHLFNHIFIGVQDEYRELLKNLLSEYFNNISNVHLVAGACTRMGTFLNIYDEIKKGYGIYNTDYMCLTDANRPFVKGEIYEQCLERAKQYGIACPARRVFDGICISKDGRFIDKIPPKNTLYSFQTPECFQMQAFERLYAQTTEQQKENLLGIAEIYSAMGHTPAIVESTNDCFKVTTIYDLKLAEIIAKERLTIKSQASK